MVAGVYRNTKKKRVGRTYSKIRKDILTLFRGKYTQRKKVLDGTVFETASKPSREFHKNLCFPQKIVVDRRTSLKVWQNFLGFDTKPEGFKIRFKIRNF